MPKPNVEEIIKDFNIYASYRSNTWDKVAIKACKYFYGDQWSDEDKDILRAQFRSPSVDNNILPIIDLIIGHWLQGRVDLVVKPFDRFGDVELADIFTTVIKAIETINNMPLERRMQVLDGFLTGFGICEKWFSRDEDIEGELKVRQASPFHFYLDPCFEKYNYEDGKKMFKETWLSYPDIKRIYGNKVARQVPRIKGYYYEDLAISTVIHYGDTTRDYGNAAGSAFDDDTTAGIDKTRGKYRVIEQYEMLWEDVEYYYRSQTGEKINIEELEELEKTLVKDLTIKIKESHIHLTTIICDNIVAEDIHTGARKWAHLFSMYFPYFLNGKFWGIVENLFSGQDAINKRKSTILHILSTHDNSGIWYEEGAFPEEVASNINEELAINGMATMVTEGTLAAGKIKEKAVKDVPPTLRWIVMNEKEDLKYISGATDAIQGVTQRQESGTAKKEGIQQAAVKLAGVIENFRETQRLDGNSYIFWIQTKYTGERVFRVLGEEYGKTIEDVYINHPQFGLIFNDVTIGKYDVSLEYETRTASERERIKWMLIELSNSVPAYADIIAEYVLMYSDIPQKEKIYQEFKQRQQAIQQAQQMQMAQGAPPKELMPPGGGGRGPIQSAIRPERGPRRMPAMIR